MNVQLRAARSTDAGSTGLILWDFMDQTPWMPQIYSAAQTISFCGVMIDRGWVTVAQGAGGVVGFLAQDGDEVSALYVANAARGQGIGAALLDHAKSGSDGLSLWTYQVNDDAVRFYRERGFSETRRSDGTRNDENLPDVQLTWTQGEPR
jgi:ribosomal protein S18 acetylase RimI-like enzyme